MSLSTPFPSPARTYSHELPPITPLRIIGRAMYPNRQTIRLQNYDYSHPGMYFITICTHERESILGTIDAGYMIPTDAGKFVEQSWHTLPNRFANLKTDKFVLMPNHVHAILFLESPQYSLKPGAASGSPTTENSLMRAASGAPTPRPSLAEIVRAFKSLSAIGVNKIRVTPSQPLWQRNYYEHIIRTTQSLDELRRYIQENHARWLTDEENPMILHP